MKWFTLLLTCATLTGCAKAHYLGRGDDGRKLWRIECPAGGTGAECRLEAKKRCGGDYSVQAIGSRNNGTRGGLLSNSNILLIACR